MERKPTFDLRRAAWFGAAMLAMTTTALAADMPNACPVDGCTVGILAAKKVGDEIQLTLKANYTPDMSKNHIHVWWGENYTVKQVSNNAEPVYKVKHGEWHPMA